MKAKTTILTVYEHQVLTAADFDLASDFTWLLEQDFEVFTPSRKQGQWCLSVRQYIGVVRLPSGTLLEILPKIAQPSSQESAVRQNLQAVANPHLQATRAWVQRMLSTINSANANIINAATLRPKHLSQLSSQLQEHSSTTLPLSEWLLAEFVELLAQYEPLRQYASHEQNSSSLQGKLLIKQQLQHNSHQPHRFYSEVTQLAQTTLSNRFIKQAWQLVAGIVLGPNSASPLSLSQSVSVSVPTALLAPTVPPLDTEQNQSLRARAHYLQSRWQAIERLTGQECQRLAHCYNEALKEIHKAPIAPAKKQIGQQLLALAYWVLSTNTELQSAGSGIQDSSNTALANRTNNLQLSLFINMHHAFEAWVSITLAQQFQERDPSYQLQTQPQQAWLVDDAGTPCVTVVPDLYVSYQQHPSHIVDMKWKAIRSSRDISANDAYQLAAYAQAYQVDKVWLVYPVSQPDLAEGLAANSLEASITKTLKAETDINNSDLHLQPSKLISRINTGANEGSSTPAAGFEIWLVPFNVDSGKVIIFNKNKYYDLF